MKKYRVLVLMSSYNGEKYISEQIVSILNQEGVNVHLLIRDDGSKDNTCPIIQNFNDDRITLIKGNNIGCIDSFSSLVKEAVNLTNEYDYFAFSDQDDVWLSKKLFAGINKLTEVKDKTKPLLYACNLNIVDANNNFITISHQNNLTIRKGGLLVDSKFPGCAMIFNAKAVQYYNSKPPRGGLYHDHWLALICLFFGKIIYDSQPYINYRQHANNVLGAHHFLLSKQDEFKGKLKDFFQEKDTIPHNAKEVGAFLDSFKPEMKDEDIRILETYLNYNKSFKNRLLYAFHYTYFPAEGGKGYFKHVLLHVIRTFLNKI